MNHSTTYFRISTDPAKTFVFEGEERQFGCRFYSSFGGLTFTGKERDEEKETSSECFASEPKVTNTFESKQLSEYRGEEPRSGTLFDSIISTTYHGARYMDHELMTMWLSVDPMADKYPGISPYAYCAWNPIKLVDPDGMEIIIPGKTSISYSIGMSTNGLSGFQKRVVKSLNKIGQTSIGKELLTDLCDSKNKFYIKKGSNGFEHDDSQKAYKNQYTSDPDLKSKYDAIKARKEDAFEGGSGGTIFWTGKGEILPTTKGGQRNKITDLAHELFHAMDANHGRLDDRLVDGVSISDWQAVYNENILRGQMRAPLRTHYMVGVHEDGRYSCGLGPSMINSDGKPIKPSWR